MSVEIDRVNRLIDENLPKSIDGYTLRRAILNNVAVIQYSKSGSYLVQSIPKTKIEIEDYKKNVLHNVVTNSLEKSYLIIKKKLGL